MSKYQALIKKIQTWQKDPHYSTFNFSPAELALIADTLETIQFLEIIFKARKQGFDEVKEKLENHV